MQLVRVVLVAALAAGCGGNTPRPPTVMGNQATDEVVTPAPAFLGSPDGAVQAEYWFDLECPPCLALAAVLADALTADPDGLGITLHSYPMPHHAWGKRAAAALMAARQQGHFDDAYEALLARARIREGNLSGMSMAELLARRDAARAIDDGEFIEVARALGLDEARFVVDLDSDEVAAALAEDVAAGEAVRLDSVPWLVINGRVYDGDLSTEAIRAALRP